MDTDDEEFSIFGENSGRKEVKKKTSTGPEQEPRDLITLADLLGYDMTYDENCSGEITKNVSQTAPENICSPEAKEKTQSERESPAQFKLSTSLGAAKTSNKENTQPERELPTQLRPSTSKNPAETDEENMHPERELPTQLRPSTSKNPAEADEENMHPERELPTQLRPSTSKNPAEADEENMHPERELPTQLRPSTSKNPAEADEENMHPERELPWQLRPSTSKYPAKTFNEEDEDIIETDHVHELFGDVADISDSDDDPTFRPPLDPAIIADEDEDGDERQHIQEAKRDAVKLANSILTYILNSVWKSVKPRKRWCQASPENWAVNIGKRNRSQGLPYKIRSKERPAKVPKDIDCSACKFKCTEVFSNTSRNEICRFYWNQDYKGRKDFILANVSVKAPQRVLAVKNKRTQKIYTKKCYFNIENQAKQVCQNFFCKTLCIAPSVVIDAIQKRTSFGHYNSDDSRGHHEPPNKISAEARQEIKSHIESFPAMESHYTRKDTKRKYLSKDLNVRKMYMLYKDQCVERGSTPASEITYRRVFGTDYNYSFFVPKKDQCLICTNYDNAADAQKKEELKPQYTEHVKRKEDCNREKESDKDRANKEPHFCAITFDLQAVLQIPHCEVSLLYYSRKLNVYNLTIYELALPNNGFCYLWSEINGNKGSCEVGTILYQYLTECVPSTVTEISLFSDTCGGQNRNKYVAALLLWAVNNINNIQIIEQKFLESGHTYMEADSMHSAIESQKKNTAVYSMKGWISICQKARRKRAQVIDSRKVTREPYKVKEEKYDQFYDLKDLCAKIIKNSTKDDEGNPVKWLLVKRLKYVKGDKKIYFNYDMSENFHYVDTRGYRFQESKGLSKSTRNKKKQKQSDPEYPRELNKLYHSLMPITKAKKRDLLELCTKGVFPDEMHPWVENLPTDELLEDRVPDVAADESEVEER